MLKVGKSKKSEEIHCGLGIFTQNTAKVLAPVFPRKILKKLEAFKKTELI